MFSHLRQMDESDLDWAYGVELDNSPSPWSKDGFARALHQGINYVFCDHQGQRLGFCCLLPVVDELHVLNLSIERSYQGQGIGKQALQAVLQRFEQTHYRTVMLEVRRTNKIARRLYQTLGFTQDGVRKGYYATASGEREDAILMSCALY